MPEGRVRPALKHEQPPRATRGAAGLIKASAGCTTDARDRSIEYAAPPVSMPRSKSPCGKAVQFTCIVPAEPSIPTAVVRPRPSASWAWLLPLAALILTAWLVYRAWSMRGIPVRIHFENGYGLKAGDDVRYRGISVGRVEDVILSSNMDGVTVIARLNSSSSDLAHAGTRFWVVRPEFQLTRIAGLETLVGPRYLAVLPSSPTDPNASRQRDFVGLAAPPVVETIQPGDLEIILHTPQRGSLRPGAPVTYRQTRIGNILSVGLNGDGSAVEARAHIQQPFVQLIRPNTQFWDAGGIRADFGLTGVSFEIDSPESIISGGVALATPPPAQSGGDVVRTGHRFQLAAKPQDEWMAWQPMVAIGSSLLPPGAYPPSPLRATLGWKQGRWIKGERSVQGWILETDEGLLGPANLLKPGEKADPDSVILEVAGMVVPLTDAPAWERNGLALLKTNISSTRWPSSQQRIATDPEECLIVADFTDSPTPLAASRLTRSGDHWEIDPAISISRTMHGACVVARSDGKLLGMILANSSKPIVALLRE